MKQGIFLTVLFICAFLTFFTGYADAQTNGAVNFAGIPFPPYIMGDHAGKAEGGIAVEAAKELFSRLNMRTEIILHPWKRVLKSAKSGLSDGILLLMKTREREEYLVYSIPYIISREMFYFNTNIHPDFSWNTYSDITPYTVGLVQGYTYGEEFLKAVESYSLSVQYADSTETNIKKLAANRVDLIVEEQIVTGTYLSEHPEIGSRIKAAEKPVTVYPYHMAFTRNYRFLELIHSINDVLDQMIKDKTIESIFLKYTGVKNR
ncbi:MAG: substrate-binding periplasmic protein [Spirochaetia bacterium]